MIEGMLALGLLRSEQLFRPSVEGHRCEKKDGDFCAGAHRSSRRYRRPVPSDAATSFPVLALTEAQIGPMDRAPIQ